MTVDLSDEEIFAAADAVLASGRNATTARVRAQLGRGSPQRSGALLDRWWAQLLDRLHRNTLPAPINHALGLPWEQATAQGRQDAEQTSARQRQAWLDDRRVMEKAFAKQRQALEQSLTRERQAFADQRQRLLSRTRGGANVCSSHAKPPRTPKLLCVLRIIIWIKRSGSWQLPRHSTRGTVDMITSKRWSYTR
ncbi:DNA-binding protein [Pseudomonas sp. RT4P38]